MKKILLVVLTTILLVGCQTNQEVNLPDNQIEKETKPITSITVNKKDIYIGESTEYKDLKIDTNTNDLSTLTYTIEKNDICSLSNGILKGLKQGSTKLIISCDDASIQQTINIHVYKLSTSKTNPYKIPWEWTSCYRINDYVKDHTRKDFSSMPYIIINSGLNYLGAGYSNTTRYGPTYDCSSFIYTLYKKKYDVKVGTTTKAMKSVLKDYKVSFSERQFGDMIFGTDGTSNHVGIYLGDDLMLHCCESLNGVVVSSIYYGPFMK